MEIFERFKGTIITAILGVIIIVLILLLTGCYTQYETTTDENGTIIVTHAQYYNDLYPIYYNGWYPGRYPIYYNGWYGGRYYPYYRQYHHYYIPKHRFEYREAPKRNFGQDRGSVIVRPRSTPNYGIRPYTIPSPRPQFTPRRDVPHNRQAPSTPNGGKENRENRGSRGNSRR